ncbi:MAG TPA: DmsE family decaheme c-type cytochrome [Pyrinomonadaceae bacterium]|nr:DmsE family decaheme c-type cytochrome [Pyrinomonadaceae bacterium]
MNKIVKALLIGGFVVSTIGWLTYNKASRSAEFSPAELAMFTSDDYVGSEACKDCHEDQFKAFSHTPHSRLSANSSWKGKVTGCESCHGPGKAHIEEGDPKKIISFKTKSSKETSETCLGCHAGKEDHNNFRRGEHWRNDVGCTDCHTSHTSTAIAGNPGSNTLVSEAARRNRDLLAANMLKGSEPQLCIGCHSETKAQFSRPFHHKVLEGLVKCSDCHNPHGGFELKQTRLATGVDAGCLKCHTDKQGPFTFEHAPLKVEGCSSCHTPHGSSNAKLLTRSAVRQLCLECHSNAHEIGAPDTPNFHNQATLRYQNCTTCHVKIHGSHVDRFFFR